MKLVYKILLIKCPNQPNGYLLSNRSCTTYKTTPNFHVDFMYKSEKNYKTIK